MNEEERAETNIKLSIAFAVVEIIYAVFFYFTTAAKIRGLV